MWRATGTGNGGGGNGRWRQRQGDSPVVLLLHPPSNASASSACTWLETSKAMVEAGGIGEGGRATAGEDMDGAMADCGRLWRFTFRVHFLSIELGLTYTRPEVCTHTPKECRQK